MCHREELKFTWLFTHAVWATRRARWQEAQGGACYASSTLKVVRLPQYRDSIS